MDRSESRASRPSTRTRRSETLQTVSSAAVPLTLGAYVIGYVVSVQHYVKSGVPLHALPVQMFLGAGVLFLSLTAAAALAGSIVHGLFARYSLRRAAVGGFVLVLLFVAVLGLSLSTIQTSVYCLIATLVCALVDPLGNAAGWRPTDGTRVIYWSQLVLLFLSSAGLFSGFVYPYVPTQYGGGRPTLLLEVWTRPDGHVPTTEKWTEALCVPRAFANKPWKNSCRSISRVHESETTLFLIVHQTPGACLEDELGWRRMFAPWAIAKPTKEQACQQRVPTTMIQSVELNPLL
jgi:hypothetical protein